MLNLPNGLFLTLVGLATALATLAGGALALKLRSRMHLILGFSAGAVVAVALLDLAAEALELGRPSYSAADLLAFMGMGFLAYMLLDRAVLLLSDGESTRRGHFGAGSLTLHSFLDGLGVGFAFQVSAPAGLVVAAAVLAHDLCDGVNTVNLTLAAGAGTKAARRWLAADALAPVAGIAATRLIPVSRGSLALVLAVFAGFFLYIGASDLLPESHERHPTPWTTLTTVAGFVFICLAVRLAG